MRRRVINWLSLLDSSLFHFVNFELKDLAGKQFIGRGRRERVSQLPGRRRVL